MRPAKSRRKVRQRNPEEATKYFGPTRKRGGENLADKLYIDNVLARGAKRANEIADQVMPRVRAAIGLR
ncbi:MAG TPA: hypothetical protein DCO65_05350 [Spartobacteria bacterium]|nr:hypothetical protein [Spartobacteria bacterium]HAK06682.1 hypothetical protein [Spartobacteria bacterium]